MGDENLTLFLYSLGCELRDKVHASIESYISKKTAYIHITSRVDLEHDCYQIISIARDCVAYSAYLDFVQQKGYQYDYILLY